MKKIIVLFSILFLLPMQCSFAIVETLDNIKTEKIDLNSAIKNALQTNPQIRILALDAQTSKNDIKIAGKFQNPSLETFQNMGKSANGNPQQIGASYTFEILKRGKRKDWAKSKYLQSQNEQKFGENNLVLEVKRAYIDFLLKKSNLKIIKEQQTLSKEILDNTIKNAATHKISQNEVVQAKIEHNRAIMYTNIANSQVISAQNHFNSVMNTSNINYDTKEDFLSDDYEALLTISPYDNSINFEKIKTVAFSNRQDLLSAKQQIETSQMNFNMVKSRLIPDLELEGGYGYLTSGISETGKFTQGAYAGAKLVNIPLVYRYKPELDNAKLEIEKSKLKYEDIKIDITRNITDAWEKFSIAKDALIFYNKELLSNSKELIEASKKSLDKNEIDMTTFLVSKKLYLELMLGYQEALAQYYISYAELLREAGLESIENL